MPFKVSHFGVSFCSILAIQQQDVVNLKVMENSNAVTKLRRFDSKLYSIEGVALLYIQLKNMNLKTRHGNCDSKPYFTKRPNILVLRSSY